MGGRAGGRRADGRTGGQTGGQAGGRAGGQAGGQAGGKSLSGGEARGAGALVGGDSWSLNVSALGFLSAAVQDRDFMEQTWELTPRWRKMTVDALHEMFPSWEFQGDPSLSWIWIDTKDNSLRLPDIFGLSQKGPLWKSGRSISRMELFQ